MIVNIEKVEFLSSSGLRVLMASLNKFKHRDRDLKLAALQPFVKDVFFMTGANDSLYLFQPGRSDREPSNVKLKCRYLDLGTGSETAGI